MIRSLSDKVRRFTPTVQHLFEGFAGGIALRLGVVSGAMRAEFVVIGAGIVGASIAMQLARRSAGDVVLVDARGPAAGMSGRSFRQVRTHYSNEVTTRLAHRGIEILRGWTEHVGIGDSGYEPVGYLLAVADDQADGCAANVALGRSLGVRTELVPAGRLREIEPLLATDGLACGAWEPDSGLIDPVKTALSATVAAQAAGARTLFGTPVRALRMNGDRVCGVVTDDGDVDAGTVVLAVGPWAPPLLAGGRNRPWDAAAHARAQPAAYAAGASRADHSGDPCAVWAGRPVRPRSVRRGRRLPSGIG